MAFTAAAMYGGAAIDALIEGILPGDPSFAVAPAVVAAAIAVALLAVGPRLPIWALGLLGPLGVLLIGLALAATPGAGDGAVLYVWPVLWTTFFFGRRGAAVIIVCVGVAHAVTLLLLPEASSYAGRWIDVMVSVCVLAFVVLALIERNSRLLDRLSQEGRTDALTGLLNRRGFDERAALELARARRDGSPVAIALLDLDHFKRINDEWGHDTGDRVLVATAELLADVSREIDVVARFGGEEFVVLLPGTDEPEAMAFAERVRTQLAAGALEQLPGVRLSAGVAAALAPAQVNELVQAADAALYSAKRAGRDRTVTRPVLSAAHPEPEPAAVAVGGEG
jgi:diguanylate cyclase (GGDEF)-like protein